MTDAGGHQSFIDWMKAIGMLLIVVGHVQGNPEVLFNAVSAPVYSKQLGVAFFVFVAGWGLANAHRARPQEAFRRLFTLLLYGGACAVLMSVLTWFSQGDLNESNYLPLLLGINVFFNHFPANPTTWYIGMYLHLVLLWWWLAPRRLSPLWLVPLLLVEWLVRAWLLALDRPFTAYMLVTNWLGVFLLGYLLAGLRDKFSGRRGMLSLLAWCAFLGLWLFGSGPLALDDSFPTRVPGQGVAAMLLVSLLVSVVYCSNTLLAFSTLRCFPAPGVVRFLARHTLLIFILHMPLIWALAPRVYPLVEPIWMKKLLMTVIVMASLGALSALIDRLVPVPALRRTIETRLFARRAPRAAG